MFKILAAAGAVAFGALAASAVSAQNSVSFGFTHSETSNWTTEMLRPWFDAAGERMEGGLTYEIFAGGSVITFASSLEGLGSGVVDSTMLTTQFFRSQLPANILLVDIAGTFGDRRAATAAMAEMVFHNCPDCVAEDEEWNVVPVVVDSSADYVLLCNRPINSAEDMRGLRIRATGLAGRVIEEMGATPANVTFAEIYESLQRGVLDCAAGEAAWLTAYSYSDVVTHVIEISVTKNVIPHLISFNRDYWNDLSEADQAIFIEEGQRAYARRTYADEAEFAEARATLAERITFSEAPDWMQEAVDRANERIRAEAVQTALGAGVANAQALADSFLEIYARWEGELAGRDVSEAQMAEVLLGITANYRP